MWKVVIPCLLSSFGLTRKCVVGFLSRFTKLNNKNDYEIQYSFHDFVEDFARYCCTKCTNTNFYDKLAFLCEEVNVSQVVLVNSVMMTNFIPLVLQNKDSSFEKRIVRVLPNHHF